MKLSCLRLVLWAASLVPSAASAALTVIEPDDYAEGAVLNNVSPLMQLRIYDGVVYPNFPQHFGVHPSPSVIPVTANENPDIFGGYFTSTGTKTFGHANINFAPESRQLAMRFLAPTTQVSVDFIGTERLAEQIGVLEVFDSAGALLDTFTSSPVLAHQVSTLSLSRPAGDIAYARAFSSPAASPFGTLDNLRVTTGPSTPVDPADFDANGRVDGEDLRRWKTNFGAKDEADADGDGDSDGADFLKWPRTNRTGANGATVSAAVPEPSMLCLASVAAVWLTIHRPGKQRRTS